MTRHAITWDARDKKTGATLDELAAFVQAAMRANATGTEPVRVRTNLRAGVKTITVELEPNDQP